MSKSKRVCKFDEGWKKLQYEKEDGYIDKFDVWLTKGQNDKTGYCNICKRSLDILTMGRSGIFSHAKGVKHQAKVKCIQKIPPITLFGKAVVSTEGESSASSRDASSTTSDVTVSAFSRNTSTSNVLPAPEQSRVTSFVLNKDVTEAEILWVLRTVLFHDSLRSCDPVAKLFMRMFKDSTIAKGFTMGRTKCGYFINFGIAPYFKEILQRKLNSVPFFALSYDESLNRIFQEEQMDVILRYFNNDSGLVETKYFDSQFLKRPNAINLHDCLLKSLSTLNVGKMLQLSMDGPHVNWDVYNRHVQFRKQKEFPKIVNIGSCGLHVLHGALQSGTVETGWELNKVMHRTWKNFDESPARRDIYMKETVCDIFPLHFCKTRWIEDEPVAERSVQIWPNIVKVIQYWLSLSVSKRPKDNKSYENLAKHHRDSLMIAKLTFFKYIASLLKVFLVNFQADKPMVPFLANELDCLLRKLMCLFMVRDVVAEASTTYALIKVDLKKKENRLPLKNVRLGTAVKSELARCDISNERRDGFKKECVVMLVKIIEKFVERSPLRYSIVRLASCFDPLEMGNSTSACILKANRLIDHLFEGGWLNEKEADQAKQEYEDFVSSVCVEKKDEFLSFNRYVDRLDTFLGKYLHNNSNYCNMWKACQIIMTLSHGQSDVERGFSVNEEVLAVNMKKASLVGQRIVYDHCAPLKMKLHEFKITKELIISCRDANAKYKMALEEQKEEEIDTEKRKKRKLIQEEVLEIKRRKEDIQICISARDVDIKKYSLEAEEKNDMTLLVKANSFRKTKEVKLDSIEALETAITNLESDLNNM